MISVLFLINVNTLKLFAKLNRIKRNNTAVCPFFSSLFCCNLSISEIISLIFFKCRLSSRQVGARDRLVTIHRGSKSLFVINKNTWKLDWTKYCIALAIHVHTILVVSTHYYLHTLDPVSIIITKPKWSTCQHFMWELCKDHCMYLYDYRCHSQKNISVRFRERFCRW